MFQQGKKFKNNQNKYNNLVKNKETGLALLRIVE